MTLRGLIGRLGWSQRKAAEMLFPDCPEPTVRRWFYKDQVPEVQQPFVDLLLSTCAGRADEDLAGFLTAETIGRIRNGEAADA